MKRWVAVAAIAVSTLAFTGPALFTGRTFAATDILVGGAPYAERSETAQRPRTTLQVDQVEQLPLVAEFWASLRRGELQLWEPDVGGGVPLFTAVYNRVLAPWFITFLFLPAWLAPTAAVALALFVAQLAMYGLARRLGLARGAAVFAAVAYAFCGPSTSLILRIHEVFLLPVLLYAIHGAVVDGRARYVVLTSLTTASVWLSGFPSGGAIVMYTALAWGIYLILTYRASPGVVARAARASAATLAGIAIAAVQLLPTIEYLRVTGALDRRYGTSDVLGVEALATAFSGRFFGTFQHRDWWLGLDVLRPVQTSSTIGVVVVLLLVASIARRRMAGPPAAMHALSRFFLPSALVVLVASYVGGPVLWVIQRLPFFDNNPFHRARFVMSLGIAIAGACALDGLLTSEQRERRLSDLWSRLQTAAIVALVLAGVLLGFNAAREANALTVVARNLVVPAVAAAAAVAAFVACKRYPSAAAIVVVAALSLELQWGAWNFTPSVDADAFFPRDRAFDAVAGARPGGPSRFASTSFAVVRPMAAAYADMRDLRVAFPSHRRFRELLEAADPDVFSTGRLKTYFTDRLDPASPVLDAFAVRYLAEPLGSQVHGTGPPIPLRVAVGPTPATFEGLIPAMGLRALTVDVRPDCPRGWIELRLDTPLQDVVTRRATREIRGATTFPLPDVGPGGVPFRAELFATHCPATIRSAEASMRAPLPGSRLRVTSTDGWVVYERRSARPRAEFVARAERIDDPNARIAAVASRRGDGPVVVEGVDGIAASEDGGVEILRDEPDEVVLRARTRDGGLAVLRDVIAPGWSVQVNDKPSTLITVDHAFRGVRLPAGRSVVRFTYRPASLRVGGWLALAGLACTVLLGLFARSRNAHVTEA